MRALANKSFSHSDAGHKGTNLSHRGLVLVEEWATFEPAATPGRTTKRLVVRVKLVPRALHVISGRLERYLASRYAATLALGERVDAVLRQQILDERAASEWNASTPLATAPPLAEDAVEQQADASPTPPLRPMPPPPPPQEMAPPVPARASLAVRIHEHEKQSKKLLPLVVGFAKWAALGILVRGAGAAVLPKKL